LPLAAFGAEKIFPGESRRIPLPAAIVLMARLLEMVFI
jgi:hypothetical protein